MGLDHREGGWVRTAQWTLQRWRALYACTFLLARRTILQLSAVAEHRAMARLRLEVGGPLVHCGPSVAGQNDPSLLPVAAASGDTAGALPLLQFSGCQLEIQVRHLEAAAAAVPSRAELGQLQVGSLPGWFQPHCWSAGHKTNVAPCCAHCVFPCYAGHDGGAV